VEIIKSSEVLLIRNLKKYSSVKTPFIATVENRFFFLGVFRGESWIVEWLKYNALPKNQFCVRLLLVCQESTTIPKNNELQVYFWTHAVTTI